MIRGVAIGDVDGDGRADLAVGLEDYWLGGSVELLFGNGDGTFRQGANLSDLYSSSLWVTMADFNRDGWPDLAAAGRGDQAVSVFLSHGGGTLGPVAHETTLGYPAGFAAGDLNRDGYVDLVSSDYRNEVSVWLGDGAGGFGPSACFETGVYPTSIAIADLDGDGRADLATADDSSNTVSVLFGDGAGGFGASPTVAVPVEARSGALALQPVRPNPIATQATIRFVLPSAGRATLRVLDLAGRLVGTLEDEVLPAGEHAAQWNGRNSAGAVAAPGVYVCELRFDGKRRWRHVAVLR